MNLFDWILICLAWSLIPATLWLKRYFARRQEKVRRETHPVIDIGIESLKKLSRDYDRT